MKHGNEERQKEVVRRCVQAEPTTGEQWKKVTKDPEISKNNPNVDVILMHVKNRIGKMKGIMF